MLSDKKFCPLCKQYGFNFELEELWFEDGKRKFYRCKNRDFRHSFCEHILKATRNDLGNFACNSCYADSIEECQCMDCEVFCGECNSFYDIACGDVMSIIYDNEENSKQ